jgi:signal transduction histidine kinase
VVRWLPGPARELWRLALVALAYWVTARLSLDLALVHGQVTPVWPPTGIAVVAMLVIGLRVWPAIAIAAFAVNLPIGPTPLAAAGISIGNTLAPMASALLLRRAGFRLALDRLRDAAAIIVLGALAGMTISATVGTSVLVLSGAVAPQNFPPTWAVWWTGDAMGVLLVAPFLLSFWPRAGVAALSWRRQLELGALLLTVGVVAFAVFQLRLRIEYAVFPLIMVAALRFRLRGAAPAALIASGVAIWAAITGSGPFTNETVLQKMITLQVFNVFVALFSFVLASFVDTREREEQVSRLYLSAQLSSEAKSEFLKMAAHELRGPLTVLAGYLTLLADGSLGAPPAAWQGPLEILINKTSELNKIMDDLLDASRLDAEALTRNRALIDLRSVVSEAVDRARPRAGLIGGEIALDASSLELPVMAGGDQLGRILDNLISNGLQYSVKPARLQVTASREGDLAVVRVADNGIGIPDGKAERVFEPFYRSENAAFDHVPGTGLGLYISRHLAESHGGSLVLEASDVDRGSTFALSLPLWKSSAGAADKGPDATRV